MLIDTHAHLNDQQFESDLSDVINNATRNGVEYIIVNGTDLASSRKAIEIAESFDCVYATVGIHPLDVEGYDENAIEKLRELASNSKVVAIGEIGLDYYYDKSNKDIQIEIFKSQLKLAKELNLPVTIHTRDSIDDTLEILKQSNNHGVMHCYSGSVEYLGKFIELGYYISLAGPVTFKNAIVPKEVAKVIPLDKLLIETDCPYLTPHPNRGKRNEPSYVRLVAKEIATLREIDVEDIEKATTANALRLFDIKKEK